MTRRALSRIAVPLLVASAIALPSFLSPSQVAALRPVPLVVAPRSREAATPSQVAAVRSRLTTYLAYLDLGAALSRRRRRRAGRRAPAERCDRGAAGLDPEAVHQRGRAEDARTRRADGHGASARPSRSRVRSNPAASTSSVAATRSSTAVSSKPWPRACGQPGSPASAERSWSTTCATTTSAAPPAGRPRSSPTRADRCLRSLSTGTAGARTPPTSPTPASRPCSASGSSCSSTAWQSAPGCCAAPPP